MNALRNKVQLIGNLGAAPEIRTLENGRKMARFRLATNENYKNAQGEWVQDTQWHQVVAWGKKADLAQEKLNRGIEVLVEGKLVHRSYTDKMGIKRYTSEVLLSELQLIEKEEKV